MGSRVQQPRNVRDAVRAEREEREKIHSKFTHMHVSHICMIKKKAKACTNCEAAAVEAMLRESAVCVKNLDARFFRFFPASRFLIFWLRKAPRHRDFGQKNLDAPSM